MIIFIIVPQRRFNCDDGIYGLIGRQFTICYHITQSQAVTERPQLRNPFVFVRLYFICGETDSRTGERKSRRDRFIEVIQREETPKIVIISGLLIC